MAFVTGVNMFRQLQQLLRLVTVLRRHRPAGKFTGGLLVLLWTGTGSAEQSLNGAVAAAGHWWTGIKIEELRPVLADLKVKDATLLSPEWHALEAFLHTFSLANAGLNIHLKFKNNQQTFQQEFRAKIKSKVPQTGQPSLTLDVTCNIQPPECVKTGCWCQGGHPVLGGRLLLSIPSHVMDEGLYGELSIQFVTLLSPCVLQYPNLATQLTHIQVLVFSPSNVPVTVPFAFFQTFPANLDCHELGLHALHCSSLEDFGYSGRIIYTVEQENWDTEQKSKFPPMEQSLLLFLFLQHNDPFISHFSDIAGTEALIEQHLEVILSNNKQAVTSAMQTELKKTLNVQNGRRRDQEKLHSAHKVILSSSISIVSCSSNMDFRNACLSSMKVRDTHELSASLCESLKRVTAWKFKPKARCFSAQMDEHPESDEATRIEM